MLPEVVGLVLLAVLSASVLCQVFAELASREQLSEGLLWVEWRCVAQKAVIADFSELPTAFERCKSYVGE